MQEGKRQLERSRQGWEDNIKWILKEVGWGGVEWIHLAQDRDQWKALVNMIMKFSGSIKC
jgi:hypothetical protein